MTHDFTTRSIHAGRAEDSSAVPIFQSVNAPLHNEGVAYISAIGAEGGPTVEALETLVSDLEGAEWTIATPSGMSAISHVLLGLLQAGDRVVAHRCIYQYAAKFLNEDLTEKWGVSVEWIDMRDMSALEAALETQTKMVYFDPIANPSMHLLDTAAIAAKAKEAGAIVAVDNTLLSPYLFKPLDVGVDIVIQSATKYLAGHGDALAGVISGRDAEIHAKIGRIRALLGGMLSPMNAFLVMRGIRTLSFRMDRHVANAEAIIAWLQSRTEVTEIRYAGLEDGAADAGFTAFGSLLGFTLADNIDAQKFRYGVKLCRPWGSLGDIETLVATPTASTSRDVPSNYIRIAVGLEAPTDIIADLEQSLLAAKIPASA